MGVALGYGQLSVAELGGRVDVIGCLGQVVCEADRSGRDRLLSELNLFPRTADQVLPFDACLVERVLETPRCIEEGHLAPETVLNKLIEGDLVGGVVASIL